MGHIRRHLLTPNTPVHLAEQQTANHHQPHEPGDWPAGAPLRRTFRVNNLVSRDKNRGRGRMPVDNNVRARQILRFAAAADPVPPFQDLLTDEDIRRARFLEPQYEPGADDTDGEEERWPAAWEESGRSLRGFTTCGPWKHATDGYLLAMEPQEEEAGGKKRHGEADRQGNARDAPAAQDDAAHVPAPPAAAAAEQDAEPLSLISMGTVLPQVTHAHRPPPSSPRGFRPLQTQTQTQTQTPLAGGGGEWDYAGSRVPYVPPSALPDPQPAVVTDRPLYPGLAETQDTPLPLFSDRPNPFGQGGRRALFSDRSHLFGSGGREGPAAVGLERFTDEDMDRFRAWVRREERKKAREEAAAAGGKRN